MGLAPGGLPKPAYATRRAGISAAARYYVRRFFAGEKPCDVDPAALREPFSIARPASSLRVADLLAQHDAASNAFAGGVFCRRRPCHRREGGNDDRGEFAGFD